MPQACVWPPPPSTRACVHPQESTVKGPQYQHCFCNILLPGPRCCHSESVLYNFRGICHGVAYSHSHEIHHFNTRWLFNRRAPFQWINEFGSALNVIRTCVLFADVNHIRKSIARACVGQRITLLFHHVLCDIRSGVIVSQIFWN
jgi:hypothetical protein